MDYRNKLQIDIVIDCANCRDIVLVTKKICSLLSYVILVLNSEAYV